MLIQSQESQCCFRYDAWTSLEMLTVRRGWDEDYNSGEVINYASAAGLVDKHKYCYGEILS